MKGFTMKPVNNAPFLQFDFERNENEINSISFKDPKEIISTNEFHNVVTCLQQVQQAVNQGFYVAGYVSYEASYALIDLPHQKQTSSAPLLWFGVFQEKHRYPKKKNVQKFSIEKWKPTETKEEYTENFHSIMEEIDRNLTDQVNYTTRFQSHFIGCAYTYYHQLKKAQQAKYSAFLDVGNIEIKSLSPELFFELNEGIVTTKPMKGTFHRGKTYEEDEENRRWLETSEKNRIENDLITQLMVEEMTPLVEKASIQITNRYHVEKYPTVFQMTSMVTGNILPGKTIIDLFKGLFPSGSITGIPKQKAMEFIAQLEKYPRHIYCGAIGYITPQQNAIFNVPIRTVVINKRTKQAYYGAGGAITKRSTIEEEYNELMTKTKVLHQDTKSFQLLETLCLKNGKYLVFNEHLQRLKKSATYFNYPIQIDQIRMKLLRYQDKYQKGNWRVRLTVDQTGHPTVKVTNLSDLTNNYVKLAKKPIDRENIFLYHKTTHRSIYEKHQDKTEKLFDILLWNKHKEITEFTIGNIVVKLDDELITPPVECGLLPGTFREKLLREKIIKEQKILLDDLGQCTHMWFINSVREWVPVQLIT